jgi:hypothetical protein
VDLNNNKLDFEFSGGNELFVIRVFNLNLFQIYIFFFSNDINLDMNKNDRNSLFSLDKVLIQVSVHQILLDHDVLCFFNFFRG